MCGIFFPNLTSEKYAPTPNFRFNSDSPCHDLLFPHSKKRRKNTFVLVGKFLKKPAEYLWPVAPFW